MSQTFLPTHIGLKRLRSRSETPIGLVFDEEPVFEVGLCLRELQHREKSFRRYSTTTFGQSALEAKQHFANAMTSWRQSRRSLVTTQGGAEFSLKLARSLGRERSSAKTLCQLKRSRIFVFTETVIHHPNEHCLNHDSVHNWVVLLLDQQFWFRDCFLLPLVCLFCLCLGQVDRQQNTKCERESTLS